MVAEILISCSLCHIDGKPRVPATPVPAKIDGLEGIYDVCDEHDAAIFGPLRQLQEMQMVRPNRGVQEKLPPGWVSGTALANGGARANSGPAPVSREFLCIDATCVHPGVGSDSGIRYHIRESHPELDVRECISKVLRCGLCPPEDQVDRHTNWAGQHTAIAHVDLIPEEVRKTKGHALWLISEVRRQGDPHKTLRALDTYVAKILGYPASKPVAAQQNGATRPDSQLALTGTGGE